MTRWSCWRLRMYVDTLNGAGGGNNDVVVIGDGDVVVMMLVVVEDTKKYIRVTRLRHWTEWNWLEASLPTTKATWYKPCAFSSRCYRVLRVAAARATTALSVPQPNLFPLLRVPLYSLPSLRIHAAATFVQAAARGCRYQRRPIVSQRWRIFSNVYLQKTVTILHHCPRFYSIVIGIINNKLPPDNVSNHL